MLTNEEKRKYIRQIMVPGIGTKGQEKIRQAKVVVVGCGGLGCPVIQYLASAGVGTIGVIDFDSVNITNIHRQILYGNEDVGRKKTEVVGERIKKMHPEVTLNIHDLMLDTTNVLPILSNYDIVVDGCDNFDTRYIVNDACVTLGLPLVYGSILGFEGQIAVYNYKGGKNLRDMFPEPPNPEDVPDCSENGVLATVPGIIGTQMAHECLKLILDRPVISDRYLVYDTEMNKFNVIHY